MVSKNERQRLAMVFDTQQRHLDNQKAAIERLVSLNIVLSAALHEIADGDLDSGSLPSRARRALDEAERLAAAYRRHTEESIDEGDSASEEEDDDA